MVFITINTTKNLKYIVKNIFLGVTHYFVRNLNFYPVIILIFITNFRVIGEMLELCPQSCWRGAENTVNGSISIIATKNSFVINWLNVKTRK